jgi:hypothetical protein
MEKMSHLLSSKLVLLIALVFLGGCDFLTGENTGANEGISEIRRIGGLDAAEKEGFYLLSGVMENGGNSAHNFHVHFKFVENKPVTFFIFSNNTLNGGASFEFQYIDRKVQMTVSLNGISHTNDHTDAHILIWHRRGLHEDTEECSFDGGCIYNSEDFAMDTWLGVGKAQGSYWGFMGDSGTIIELEGPLLPLSDA